MRRPVTDYFQTVDEVERALGRRLVLGQAQGIVMERLDVTADVAFAFLSRASQQSNTKIHEVAAQLVASRILPSTIARAEDGDQA